MEKLNNMIELNDIFFFSMSTSCLSKIDVYLMISTFFLLDVITRLLVTTIIITICYGSKNVIQAISCQGNVFRSLFYQCYQELATGR